MTYVTFAGTVVFGLLAFSILLLCIAFIISDRKEKKFNY